MNTEYVIGTVGCGFMYDFVPLNDEEVPKGELMTPRTDTFMVDTCLFYENFEPLPDFPPQWDYCDVFTLPISTTEIIEIVIIDP